MCKHGTHKTVNIINKQNKSQVVVDACIADEIRQLNNAGIITLSCCCGHGKAGQIVEYENGYGKWKEHSQPPVTLIHEDSIELAIQLDYVPFPYYYADGESNGVWQMYLKTGCITEDEVNRWKER